MSHESGPPAATPAQPGHFADRLAALVEERRSQIVLGLDPDPMALWPGVVDGSPDGADAHAAAVRVERALGEHCAMVIEAAGPACVAVKVQLACFERFWGATALRRTIDVAREHGLLVILDGKRGDVPVTAGAYAQALVGETPTPFGPVPGLGGDAFTANPLLGRDALGPLLAGAGEAGAGCFVLVRTSNPGAADVQDLDTPDGPVHEMLGRMVAELGASRVGACGLSDVGAVTGATRPEHLERLRELMPHAIFLLPGVGAQGGAVSDLGAAFAPHPAAGLVAASRSIVGAHEQRGGDPASAAARAAEELRASAWSLSSHGA